MPQCFALSAPLTTALTALNEGGKGPSGRAALALDLFEFLDAITPEGAAALTAWPWGGYRDFQPVPLPLTRPHPLTTAYDGSPEYGGDWLPEVLARLRVDHRKLPAETVEALCDLLAPAGARPDGLPAWRSHVTLRARQMQGWATGWKSPTNASSLPGSDTHVVVGTRSLTTITTTLEPATQRARSDRSIARAILAAVACDIKGESLSDVSRDLLHLNDHEDHSTHGAIAKTPRGAERYRARGRLVLSVLGAWPWAHAPKGRLARDWRTTDGYVQPLRAWFQNSRNELAGELNRIDKAWEAGRT